MPKTDWGAIFSSLGSDVHTLNLQGNQLHTLNLEELQQLRGKLPYITTVYLSKEEIQQLTPEQRLALQDIFPNVHTINLGSQNQKIDPIINAQSARHYGLKVPIHSLTQLCSFFIINNNKQAFQSVQTDNPSISLS